MSMSRLWTLKDSHNQFKKPKIPLLQQIKQRLETGLDIRIIIAGEAGVGKSTLALNIAEALDPFYTSNPDEAVNKLVCFSGLEYLLANKDAPEGACLILDESGQAIHHRQFMQEINVFLSKTLIGNRFRQFVQIFCIPRLDLLDKDARGMAQLLIHVNSRGNATVYRIKPPKLEGYTSYKMKIDSYNYKTPSVHLWHVYQKKKKKAQDALNEQFIKALQISETPELTNTDYVQMVLANPTKYLKNDKWNSPMIRTLGIGRERADTIRAILEQKEEEGLINK